MNFLPVYLCISVCFSVMGMQQIQALELRLEKEQLSFLKTIKNMVNPENTATYFGRVVPQGESFIVELNNLSYLDSIPKNAVTEVFTSCLNIFYNKESEFEIGKKYITEGLSNQTPKQTFYEFLHDIFDKEDFVKQQYSNNTIHFFHTLTDSQDENIELLKINNLLLPVIECFFMDVLQVMQVNPEQMISQQYPESYKKIYIAFCQDKHQASNIRFGFEPTVENKTYLPLGKLIKFLGAKSLLKKLIADCFDTTSIALNQKLVNELEDMIRKTIEAPYTNLYEQEYKNTLEPWHNFIFYGYRFLEQYKNKGVEQKIQTLQEWILRLLPQEKILELQEQEKLHKPSKTSWKTLAKWGLGVSAAFIGTIYFLYRSKLLQKWLKK